MLEMVRQRRSSLGGDCLNVNSLCDTLISQMTKMFSISDMTALGQCSVVCLYGMFKILSFVLVIFLICGCQVIVTTVPMCVSIHLIPASCPVGLNSINWPDLQ